MIDTNMLDELYDVAALPEKLPLLLQDIAARYGARGAVLFRSSGTDAGIVVSAGTRHLFARYVAEGHLDRNERGAPMFAEHAPQFRTDSDFRDPEQMASMPVYRDLLIPMGFAVGAGTTVQGTDGDVVGLTLEGFASDAAVRRQLPG